MDVCPGVGAPHHELPTPLLEAFLQHVLCVRLVLRWGEKKKLVTRVAGKVFSVSNTKDSLFFANFAVYHALY